MAQNARRKAAPRTRRAPKARRAASRTPDSRRVALGPEERALLRRACARYRAQLPAYLVTGQAELQLLCRILRKL